MTRRRRGSTPPRGLIVAVVGADGSGKSSLARGLVETFQRDLEVLGIYFGSGDGPSSVVRWPMTVARRFVKGGRNGGGVAGAERRRIGPAKTAWALALALEKRQKLRRADRARQRGVLVVGDRYPQSEIHGFNDGPLLQHWTASKSAIRRAMASWEGASYRLADDLRLNLVLRINVSLDVAAARRPEHDRADLQRRITAVESLAFTAAESVHDLDGDCRYDEVLRAAERAVMRHLSVRQGAAARPSSSSPSSLQCISN